jgi:hypothetical protein
MVCPLTANSGQSPKVEGSIPSTGIHFASILKRDTLAFRHGPSQPDGWCRGFRQHFLWLGPCTLD